MVPINKPGTAKVGAIHKAQKAQNFSKYAQGKLIKKVSKHQKGAFSAGKTLQKFRYNVETNAFFRSYGFSVKHKITSDITSEDRIERGGTTACFRTSACSLVKRNLVRI